MTAKPSRVRTETDRIFEELWEADRSGALGGGCTVEGCEIAHCAHCGGHMPFAGRATGQVCMGCLD